MPSTDFEVFEPQAGELPVVVEVPHAGLRLDPETMAWTAAPVRAIARDADLYVDELVDKTCGQGASVLVARMSRYVVDLNREAGDFDGLSVRGEAGSGCPRGVVWRLTADEEPALQEPLTPDELSRRLERFYRPYHAALDELVRRKRARFGGVVVLSFHSMPSVGKSLTTGQAVARADVVVGTRGRSTAARPLIALVDEHVRSYGWSVAHDDPYRGGATTGRLGTPSQGVHAIQLEIARRLYMSETTLAPREGTFALVQAFCGGLVARIGTAALG
jgi:N-formylglutamate amidohydrolase